MAVGLDCKHTVHHLLIIYVVYCLLGCLGVVVLHDRWWQVPPEVILLDHALLQRSFCREQFLYFTHALHTGPHLWCLDVTPAPSKCAPSLAFGLTIGFVSVISTFFIVLVCSHCFLASPPCLCFDLGGFDVFCCGLRFFLYWWVSFDSAYSGLCARFCLNQITFAWIFWVLLFFHLWPWPRMMGISTENFFYFLWSFCFYLSSLIRSSREMSFIYLNIINNLWYRSSLL